ncbi:MAG: WecB/TagA/CpsF family glycosyltransferase [Patescibacteria group bacterium]
MANILGINLSELSRLGVMKKIGEFLNGTGQHYLVTPNPEIILNARRDEELFYILNKADLAVADGFGLKLAGFLFGKKIPRLTGADLTLDLLRLAQEKNFRITVLNWRGGLSRAEEIKDVLKKEYPRLETLILDASRSQPLAPKIIDQINDFAPTVLFSTFGSPYQEKKIYHNLTKLPAVRLALGVGGTFDFITGRAKRAPKFLRAAGLEWLWRLIIPAKGHGAKIRRGKRIYRATLVFGGQLFRAKISRFFYRPNVACLLYKKNNGLIKILIVEREDEPGHWQLPQGGTDGESLAKAGAREMREELNTDKFLVKATFKNTYSYLFPPVSQQRSLSLSPNYKYDYKGQRQGLCIAEFTGRDEDIKVNFWDHRNWKWVEEHELVSRIQPARQESAKIFLTKFKSLNL